MSITMTMILHGTLMMVILLAMIQIKLPVASDQLQSIFCKEPVTIQNSTRMQTNHYSLHSPEHYAESLFRKSKGTRYCS